MKDELISELLSYVKGTKDFILEQAPDIFNQIIKFELIKSIFFGVFFGALSIFCILLFKANFEEDETNDFLFVISLIGGLISFIIFICSIYDLIFVLCAPKYYLIKLLMGLGK